MSEQRCLACGKGTMSAVGEEARPWRTLPGVIVEGVKIYRCQACGEEEEGFERLEELIHLIGQTLLKKEGRLSGPELRFLRKMMGWSGRDFASRMGVTPEQVSRWENGHEPVGASNNMLVRALIALDEQLVDYSSQSLALAANSDDTTLSLLARRAQDGHWVHATT